MTPRGRGPRALAAAVARITKPIFGKRGFAQGAILTDWATIVGPHLAGHTVPERIAHTGGRRGDGTLHLRVDTGALALELQHLEPLLVERVNGYFGYRAVARLKLVQGPVPERRQPPAAPSRRLDSDQEERLARHLAEVEDADLRARLDALGRAVMARSGTPAGK